MKTFFALVVCIVLGFMIWNRRVVRSEIYELFSWGDGFPRGKEIEEKQITWSIYALNNNDTASTNAACRTIKRVFNFGVCAKGIHPLPAGCVDQNNAIDGNRCLNEIPIAGKHCIFISNQEIYSDSLCVRGLTKLHGNTILIKKNPYFERVLIHEMGHVLGLKHCNNLTCVMAIYNDEQGTEEFCSECRRCISKEYFRKQ